MTTKKKALPDDVGNFFQGESIFFNKPEGDAEPHSSAMPKEMTELQPSVSPHSAHQEASQTENQHSIEFTPMSISQEVSNDVEIDAMTSLFHDVNLKEWRETIENTETQNSALRLTSEERYAIEDVISELRRKERVKTSMNEVARLGILFLIHEYKKNRHSSILYKVKKA